jgi:tight adherence protein C
LADELQRVLAETRAGEPLVRALDALADRTGLLALSRFADGLAVALERGTPLADVLRAQAGDIREAIRRELIESGARREVSMMIPVVFLVRTNAEWSRPPAARQQSWTRRTPIGL